jgi:hypothetical protein
MCQKGGNREGSHDRSDGGYCRYIDANGNDLSQVTVDVILKNHNFDKECACRSIWVMLCLEADIALIPWLILSMIDQLAYNVPIMDGTTVRPTFWFNYPKTVKPGQFYYILCECQNDLSLETPCLFCLMLFDAVRTSTSLFAVSNYFDIARYV